MYLVDKSAYERQRHHPAAAALLEGLAADNQLAICEIVALELLYSARGPDDYDERWRALQEFVWLRLDERIGARALDIQRRLAKRGHHRRPIPDLLIAATAIEHGAVVLHFDRDFDIITEETALVSRWITPRPERETAPSG